jgi:hypothetical protein
VTNSGRPEDPRTTGTAWVAVRNRDLATPGRRRCSGSARPRRRTRCSPGGRRFPCLDDARTCAGHQGRVLATAGTGPQQAVQQVTKRNWSASSTRAQSRLRHLGCAAGPPAGSAELGHLSAYGGPHCCGREWGHRI